MSDELLKEGIDSETETVVKSEVKKEEKKVVSKKEEKKKIEEIIGTKVHDYKKEEKKKEKTEEVKKLTEDELKYKSIKDKLNGLTVYKPKDNYILNEEEIAYCFEKGIFHPLNDNRWTITIK